MLLQTSSQRQLADLKKALPKGTCLVGQAKKYQYIARFIAQPGSDRFVIPMPAEIASFVVVKIKPDRGHPIYHMYFKPNKTFLLSAQQQSMSIGCNYLISRDRVPAKSQNFIGKVRGNFQGDEFQLYDSGDNPDRVKTRPRKHLGYIRRQQHSLWRGKTDLKLSMTVPKPQQSSSSSLGIHQYQPIDFICSQDSHNPLALQTPKKGNIQYLQLREESSNSSQSKRFVLQSSIKSESLVLVQKSETFFELEIGCPLTFMQGFGCLLALVETLAL